MNLDLLPSVRSQRHREKVEKLWRWTWRICMWTILFAAFAIAGYHASPKQGLSADREMPSCVTL